MPSLRLHRQILPVGVPLAMAIGNFDGVHLGHQAIFTETRNAASRLGFQASALSFSPLPREYFARIKNDPTLAPSRLMSTSEKLGAMQQAGLAHVFIPRFAEQFAAQSAPAFLDSLRAANVRWIMVGEDFRFGAKRAGDVALMQDYGRQYGIDVETMADIADTNGGRISSSAIREALNLGQLADAKDMLGRRYAITGRVIHGKKLGRTLGFPTANISLGLDQRSRKPALGGVFAVQCRLVTRGLEGVAALGKDELGGILNGVANLGTNPAVSIDNRLHLEVFLFDYAADLYGKRLHVSFVEKIRDEQNFANLEQLVTQMHDDCKNAKQILSRMNDDGRS